MRDVDVILSTARRDIYSALDDTESVVTTKGLARARNSLHGALRSLDKAIALQYEEEAKGAKDE